MDINDSKREGKLQKELKEGIKPYKGVNRERYVDDGYPMGNGMV